MPTYTCEKCARVFKQKSGYDDHKSKKNDCSKTTVINTVIENKVIETVREVIRATQSLPEITKENMPAFFEALHNLLWNKAGLNPESALIHMIFFFAYRLIEQQADIIGLPQECRWSYLVSLKNENDLFETIRNGVNAFRRIPATKPFFKPHEIQKADVVFEIVQQINRISIHTLQNTDTLGDIFEYMLGRGMSTMADEGQYFTSRMICRLAFKLAFEIKQTLRRPDGSLCTFADWFCGTGGFPAEYVKGVRANLSGVDWRVDSSAIYCQDMNLSSVTTTLLNMLILTGIPFSSDTIRGSNSFTDPITKGAGASFPGLTIDYCFMNPPYGGDKTKGKEYKFAYSKIIKLEDGKKSKRYYVNEDIQNIGIEDDDKVSAGVQLGMATLSNDGGVCCIVLPQGFFFGSSKKGVELRKKIAEEYKIHYIVDIASGSFANTTTKTSMMVFQKGVGPTENVRFIGLDETILVETTLQGLRDKNYSLNYKQYLPQTDSVVEGFDIVKLGDICNINFGERVTKKNNSGTLYPVYGGGNETFKVNQKNREGITCKISRFGISVNNCVQIIYGDYWLLDSGFTITAKEGISDSYIWNWLLQHKNIVYQCGRATAQMNLDIDTFKSIQIPLPSFEQQKHIVEAIDGWTQLAQIEEASLKLLEKQVMFELKEMGRGQPMVKLGEVCNFVRGKPLSKKDFVDGDVPVIGGGIKPVGNHNVHNREPYSILISQSGSAGHISRYNTHIWASDCFSLHNKNNILEDYLYYTVLHLKETIQFLKEGTAQPHIYPSTIENLQLPLPPLDRQQTLQSDFDEIRHKHQNIDIYKIKAQEAIRRLIPGAN
jgi:type I restriction enzyme S subunit